MIQSRDNTSAIVTREPAWEVARLFPDQGAWDESEFLHLDSLTGGRIELSDGHVELLPMPTVQHQLILQWLFKALDSFVSAASLGLVLVSGARVRLRPGLIREPDVVFISKSKREKVSRSLLDGADLAIEVVSEDDPGRDYARKRMEYAAAGIGEYWIVDPRSERILVLTLPTGSSEYAVAGEYAPGSHAVSPLLEGFTVDVAAVFDYGKQV